MKKIIRNILAGLTGVVTVFIVMGGMEFLWLNLYPRPEGIASNTEQFQQWFQSLPTVALFLVLAMLLVAAFLGGWVSCLISRTRPILFSGIVGALVLALYFFNHLTVNYPVWLTVAVLIGIPSASFFASYLAPKQSVT